MKRKAFSRAEIETLFAVKTCLNCPYQRDCLADTILWYGTVS
jgi:hypothetical protein